MITSQFWMTQVEFLNSTHETNFMFCPKTKAVLAAKGAKNIYEIDRGLAKSNLTVMFSFSALGVMCPPMIIYPYKRIREEIRKTIPDEWGYGISDNGWMTKQTFYEYISKVFHPFLVREKIKLPIIYFVDGHSTHLTLQVSQLCVQLGIILIALYPNSTRILQPADVAAFKPLKNAWNNAVLKWRRTNPGKNLTKDLFGPLLHDVVKSSILSNTLVNGFRACGLFPWDKTAINFSKCLGRSTKLGYQKMRSLSHHQEQDAFDQFCRIIGWEKVAQLEACKNDVNITSDFKDLQNLYTFFKSTSFKQILEEKQKSDAAVQTDIQNLSELSFIDISAIDEFVYTENEFDNLTDTLDKGSITGSEIQPTFEFLEPPPSALKFAQEQSKTHTAIDDILDWPETPLRKGTKPQKQKKSFVITNASWIKEEEKRKDEKRKLETDREEKKAKRIEKKRNKDNEKLKRETKKATNPCKLKQTNKNQRMLPKTNKPSVSSTVTTGALALREESPVEKMLVEIYDEISQDNENLQIQPREGNHIKNLFSNEICAAELGENSLCSGQMCFSCTKFMTAIPSSDNCGIRCSSCRREYHIKCLKKNNYTHIPIFTCKTCSSKTLP